MKIHEYGCWLRVAHFHSCWFESSWTKDIVCDTFFVAYFYNGSVVSQELWEAERKREKQE